MVANVKRAEIGHGALLGCWPSSFLVFLGRLPLSGWTSWWCSTMLFSGWSSERCGDLSPHQALLPLGRRSRRGRRSSERGCGGGWKVESQVLAWPVSVALFGAATADRVLWRREVLFCLLVGSSHRFLLLNLGACSPSWRRTSLRVALL